MDEEDDRDFSKSIVFGFLEQAEQTFAKMDAELYVFVRVRVEAMAKWSDLQT
jgi:osomolarity two-component system phosphorelay intermediate protein YPD1